MSLSSCKSTQQAEEQQLKEVKMALKETLLKEGFTAGTIVQSTEEGDCEWTIQLDNGIYYESLTMKDEFKKDNKEVFFKFRPLRRMSKCTKASPVEIVEMKTAQ
jgi:hypothetical protein